MCDRGVVPRCVMLSVRRSMIHWGSKVHVATVGSSETSVSEKLLLCERQRARRNNISRVDRDCPTDANTSASACLYIW